MVICNLFIRCWETYLRPAISTVFPTKSQKPQPNPHQPPQDSPTTKMDNWSTAPPSPLKNRKISNRTSSRQSRTTSAPPTSRVYASLVRCESPQHPRWSRSWLFGRYRNRHAGLIRSGIYDLSWNTPLFHQCQTLHHVHRTGWSF